MKKTIKQAAIEFVKNEGPKSHGEIKKFMYEYRFGEGTYDPIENRGWYTSYFSENSRGEGAILLKGNERLIKDEKTKLYNYFKEN